MNELISLLQSLQSSPFNQSAWGSYNPMTGYNGQLPPGAQNEVAYQKLFDYMNSPMQQQQRAQMFQNAGNDAAMARSVGQLAYKNQDNGPMGLNDMVNLLGKMRPKQPFRNQPLQMFPNPWGTGLV